MAGGAHLYLNTVSYDRCSESTRAIGFNASPAPEDGMDTDVTGRIGYLEQGFKSGDRWFPGTTEYAGTNKNRMQGICCGITTGWLAAFLGTNPVATDHELFKNFFVEALRFQGAYGKDYGDTPDDQRRLLLRICRSSFELQHTETTATPGNLSFAIPFHRLDAYGTWAAYMHAHGHVTGIGSTGMAKNFIMDANGGLFEYDNRNNFIYDLKDYLRDIRADAHTQAPQATPQARIIFYHRGRRGAWQ